MDKIYVKISNLYHAECKITLISSSSSELFSLEIRDESSHTYPVLSQDETLGVMGL